MVAKKKSKRALARPKKTTVSADSPKRLLTEIRQLIETARQQTARAVNSALVVTYWHIGRRIRQDVLKNDRAEYGKEIVSALSAQLSWSHFVEILSLDDSLKRDFYAELCRVERWSVRTLRHKIGHLLFERTAVSKKPEDLIQQDITALREEDRLTPDMVFRDPYFLDFLGLTGQYAEKDVEQAILRELEAFILELGSP